MAIQVALLRGINVGRCNRIAMSDLRALLGTLGFPGVESLLQSGNLVFDSGRRTAAELECLLEVETARRLNVPVHYVVRSAKEWGMVVARNPFPEEAKHDPSHLVVMFLKTTPPAPEVQALQDATRPERIRSEGKHLYVVYPEGIGDSKLTNALIEKKLGVRGTARNWNTVLKLAALCKL